MNNLTLKQLRYFEALAKHGHFGRAADVCAISQPALSVQIKELELALGTPLFERGPRQVRLTAFGETLAVRVRQILRSVDELGDLARAAGAGLSGRLRIGVIPTIAPYLLPALIGELRRSHPELEIDIRETMTERLIEELGEGRIDTAIVALPVSVTGITEEPLFDEALMLVRSHEQSDDAVPLPSDLRDMRLLMLEQGHCFRDQALAFCNMAPAASRDGMDGSSLATLVQMVGAGIGVTLVPEMAVAVETRSAPVSVARFPQPEPQRRVGLIWRTTNPLAAQFRELGQRIKDVAAALPRPD